MKRTYTLVILDGWGIGRHDESNPIFGAHPENIRFIEEHFPVGGLQSSGISIGMPWDEEGNSEIGHLTIGAGKVFYQHYPRISLAIEDGSFFQNAALKNVFAHARTHGSAVHLVGLVGEGIVHSAAAHLSALIEMAKREKCEKLFIHAFTDGRDSAPRAAVQAIQKVIDETKAKGVGSVASISGRYFAMDRDNHWDRTALAYRALTEASPVDTFPEGIKKAYTANTNDEYVEPFVMKGNEHPIQDRDAVFFFNFREDRMRQIVRTFTDPSFSEFPVKKYENIFIASMTEYKTGMNPHAIAFKKEVVAHPLGEVISRAGKTQLRIAETEKYAHVTYFFNGLREEPFPNEYRVLIPSKNVARHEEHPEMMASAITDRAVLAMNEGGFDFILVNYANADIIAHTGKYDATYKAVQILDKEIGRLMRSALEGNHVLIITSDHGNAESVINLQTGEEETKHNANPVPFYVIAKELTAKKEGSYPFRIPTIGILSDVAPTILSLMGISKPDEMTGQNLMEQIF